MTAAAPTAEKATAPARKPASTRIASVDALRGLVMFTMIFVNDLAGAPGELVPGWMKHYQGESGMTFVDLVFPAFLFIVGMSIPFALGSRLSKGEPLWKILLHVLARVVALLAIGILMVNGTPSSEEMGWPGRVWVVLMFVSAMLAFCTIAPPGAAEKKSEVWKTITLILRCLGFVGLIYLAFVFRDSRGRGIISLSPFSIRTSWYGILGLIGWAYLVGSVVYLICRGRRTSLLGCMVLLLCLFAADKNGMFSGFWLKGIVNIGETLGSLASITAAGVLLASMLMAADMKTTSARTNFALLFIAGCAAGAWLLDGLYGINKIGATPSWCLWACAITAALWLVFYYVCDVMSAGFVAQPLVFAGQNVLLAYLISEMLPSLLRLLNLGGWYWRLAEPNLACAIARSMGCAAVILTVTVLLNRVGFRLKL